MQISLNIILEVLQSYHINNYVASDKQLSFNACLPLPEEPRKIRPDCIYVGGLTHALDLKDAGSDLCCICVRDRLRDSSESLRSLPGLIIVEESITQTALLSLITARFFEIMNWVHQMDETLINNGSLQELVDLCAPIIDNYMAINDASLMLLAYSKFVFCDDPICIEFVKNGYHSDEYIRQFRKHNLFKTWDTVDAIYIDDSCEVAKYTAVEKVFRFQNAYFAQIVMTCNRTPVTPGLLDLYQIFINVVEKYIKRLCAEKNAPFHMYDNFLIDVIERNVTNTKVIEERAQYVGIPLTGQYCLFIIVPTDIANSSIAKMMTEFSELFPRVKFMNYHKSIVAIGPFLTRDLDDQMAAICSDMEQFLQKYDARCGMSLYFSSLIDITYAYQQAVLAMKYAECLPMHILFKNQRPKNLFAHICFFSQIYIYCLLGESGDLAEIWHHSEYHNKLKKLFDYGERHKSDSIQLLNTYLSLKQNATEVGTVLKTHRNNIIYHINRIKEVLGLDMDDPAVCFALQASIVLIELYGFDIN